MRRLFWTALGLGAGATAAVLAGRWARRQRDRYAPAALGRQAADVVSGAASLAQQAMSEFRAGVAEREADLRRGWEEGQG